MSASLLAIAPIFLLIIGGLALRHFDFVAQGFWAPAEKLTYFLLFPALIVTVLADAELAELDAGGVGAAVAGAVVIMGGLMIALRRAIPCDGPAFASLFQGAVRMNTYIGLGVSLALYGSIGADVAAIAITAIVFVANTLCVIVHAIWGANRDVRPLAILREMGRNPLLAGTVVGVALNLSGFGLPPVIGPVIAILGEAALPLGLLTIGAALNLEAAKRARGLALLILPLKLAAMPALTFGLCALFGVVGPAAAVATVFNGTPASPSSYALARHMGGDAELMAALITLETAGSMISLPVLLALLA